jgi:hypothetical protein
MPDLSFRVLTVTAVPYAAIPTVAARLQLTNADPAQKIHSISLNCQVQLEPLRRSYSATEEARLLDLFGERERWARTMKPMLWTNVVLKLGEFSGATEVDLPLPCTFDFDVAATKYFYGLEVGKISVSALFSGTIFYAGQDGALQVAPIPWACEARFELPVEVWRTAIDAHYPDLAWMRVPKETFDRLYRFKVARGIPMWDQLLNQLMDRAELAELEDIERSTTGAPR